MKHTTMLLDYPPALRAGDVVEFLGFEPGNCVAIRLQDGTEMAVDAAYVSADFIKPSWGGARQGAGRPALADEPTVERTISFPLPLDAAAKRLGSGNRSAGVRLAIEAAINGGVWLPIPKPVLDGYQAWATYDGTSLEHKLLQGLERGLLARQEPPDEETDPDEWADDNP